MLPRVYMALMWTLTLPYYRYFQVNTLSPIQRISKYASLPDEQDTVSRLLVRWRTRKLEELRFITIAVSSASGNNAKELGPEINRFQVCCTSRSSDWSLLMDINNRGILASPSIMVLLLGLDNTRHSACRTADFRA